MTKRVAYKPYQRKARVNQGIGFPEQTRSTLRYFATVDVGAATFGTTKQYFRCNGLFDPDITGTGHQPLGFDQLMTIYTSYVVLGAKIKCTFFGREDTNSSMSGVVGIYQDDSTSNTLPFEALIEGSGKKKWGVYTASDQKVVLTDTYKSKVVYSKATLADTSQRGTASTDPSDAHTWCLFNCNQASTTESVYVAVDIEYDVVFFERADLASS